MAIVYKIICEITGGVYIGWTSQALQARFAKHCRNRRRNCYLAACIQKYGKSAFRAEQLYEFESEGEAISKEVELIAALKTNRCTHPFGDGMNMTDGGEGTTGYRHDVATKEVIRQASKGRRHSASTRRLISTNSKAVAISYVRTPEHKANISSGLKRAYATGIRCSTGRKHSPETRAKMSLAQQGKKRSLETRQKMAAAKLGKPVSAQTREKLRIAGTGRKQSPQTIAKRMDAIRERRLTPAASSTTRTTPPPASPAPKSLVRQTRGWVSPPPLP